jgi:ring-1,2-phenylacetyl-CoA epoxidase subunit PaaA
MKQGKEQVILMSQGSPLQRTMVQDAVSRWWWPTIMMFGPHDHDSPNSPVLIRWGIKTKTNDQLRQDFVNQVAPEVLELGLSLPDPELHYDQASGNWLIGPIDWDEFWRVVKGDGPCNAERIAARRKAHADGEWVREALAAYAERQPSS